MKFFLLIYYFLRSVVLRGLLNTLKLLKAEKYYEKQFGIETAQFKKSNSTKFYHYQGASYLVLLKFLPEIFKQTQAFTFFDIGCGRGRAVFVAESCGYTNLIGIDLDEQLIISATNNIEKYTQKSNPDNYRNQFTFIVANAIEFNYKNEPTVYFLFNPFNAEVLEKVLEKIYNSTTSETYFIYMNPKHARAFGSKNFVLVNQIKTKRYLEALVFKLVKQN